MSRLCSATPHQARTDLVFINGRKMAASQATISVFDHAFLYGDSVFETIKSYQGFLFALDAHLQRLERSSKHVHLQIPVSRRTLTGWIAKAIAPLGKTDARVRVMITRGVGPIGLDISRCQNPQVLVFAQQLVLSNKQGQARGISTIIARTRKTPSQTLHSQIKSGNYLFSKLAYAEGQPHGAAEVILLNYRGNVSEGSTSNIFLIRGNRLITPSLDSDCLDGITRKVVLKLGRDLKFRCEQRPVKPKELFTADEVFFTGTIREICPVASIDGKKIKKPKFPMVPVLQKAFRNYVNSLTPC